MTWQQVRIGSKTIACGGKHIPAFRELQLRPVLLAGAGWLPYFY